MLKRRLLKSSEVAKYIIILVYKENISFDFYSSSVNICFPNVFFAVVSSH
jgi:hypothetical protein